MTKMEKTRGKYIRMQFAFDEEAGGIPLLDISHALIYVYETN